MTCIIKYSCFVLLLTILSCNGKKNNGQREAELKSIDLIRGDIALCSSENGEFGTVNVSQSCSEKARGNFNLATALDLGDDILIDLTEKLHERRAKDRQN